MRILAIGNSYSQDATRYLHQIARRGGVALNVSNLYIGGCPLSRHFKNMGRVIDQRIDAGKLVEHGNRNGQ